MSLTELALLIPRGIVLAEINALREKPISDAELQRVLVAHRIRDYPGGFTQEGGQTYHWTDQSPEHAHHGSNPGGSTSGAIQGNYPLEYYEDGFPKLPACLDRSRQKHETLSTAHAERVRQDVHQTNPCGLPDRDL